MLVGEIELAAGVKDAALEAWKRASSLRKSARTLFGLARAEHLAGDLVSAEKDARAAMEASPGIDLVGVGTIVAEICGVLPTLENHQLLVDVAEEVETA